jgi:hypothetical protein
MKINLMSLGIVFVFLKLFGVIDWSWWWVTSPFWGVFVVFVIVVLIIGIFRKDVTRW